MADVTIRARLGIERTPPFWAEARLCGCRLEKSTYDSTIQRGEPSSIFTGEATLPSGVLLAFWTSGGESLGTEFANYWILEVDADADQVMLRNAVFFLEGKLRVLAFGRDARIVDSVDDTRAFRLRNWWLSWAPLNGGQTAPVARWLGEQIKTRALEPLPFPDPQALAASRGEVFQNVDACDLSLIPWSPG